MPSQGFEEIIDRAMSDDAFMARMRTDVDGAIAGYKLTEEEKDALRSRDMTRVEALALGERSSKRVGLTWCF